MKRTHYTIALIAFVSGAVLCAKYNHWLLGTLSLLCAASCRQKSEEVP